MSTAGLLLLRGCQHINTRVATSAKVRRIGYLDAASRAAVEPITDVFADQPRQRGWVEGENLAVEEAREFDFIVNVKAPQALGITFPRDAAAQVTRWFP